MLTVSTINVTLKMKDTMPWAHTVLRMVREVTCTSETADEVPMLKARYGSPNNLAACIPESASRHLRRDARHKIRVRNAGQK